MNSATFRFYEELNDFLPAEKCKKDFAYSFNGKPSVKDAIEALGVPHTEVDVILLNGVSVGFNAHLQDGDRVAVYPTFEALEVKDLTAVRDCSLREPRFIADVHLGKLARLLRLLGFDTLYRNDYSDRQIIRLAQAERRIILTRDRGLLKVRTVTHGYCLHTTVPLQQLRDVLRRFDLAKRAQPFSRCIACNGVLEEVAKTAVEHRLPERVAASFTQFWQCGACDKVYWQGSHVQRMNAMLENILSELYF